MLTEFLSSDGAHTTRSREARSSEFVTVVTIRASPDVLNRSAFTLMKFEKYLDKKLKGYYWRFDVTIGGERFRRGGFLMKRDCENAVAALRLLMQQMAYGMPTNIPEKTLGQLKAKLDTDKAVGDAVRRVFNRFVTFRGEQTAIRSLARADMKSFADHLRETTKLADSSYSLYMANLKTALYRAGDYFAALETWQPPKLPKLPGFTKRTKTVKPEDVGAFLRELEKPVWHADRADSFAARKHLADVIRLMCLFGARREEIEQITLQQIDWDEKTIRLRSSKTKKEHLVPLTEAAIQVLKSRPTFETGKLFNRRLESWYIVHTMQKAGEQINRTFGRNQEGWTLHDLRRTAAVQVDNSGLPYSAVQDLLGHARKDVTSTYTPAQWKALREAAEVLETWCRDIDGFSCDARALQRPPATSAKSEAA